MKLLERVSEWLRHPRAWVTAALAGCGAFHFLHLRAWLRIHPLPDGFQNEIYHLFNALELQVGLATRGWQVVHDLLFTQYWPPLIYAVAQPLVAVSLSRECFVYANLPFFVLLLGCVYGLGQDLESRPVGLLAAVTVSFLPSIYGNLRHFEPNIALTALVSCAIWMLHRSNRFSHPRYTILFGVSTGLALMTDRISGLFFIGIPSLWLIYQAFFGPRRHPEFRRADAGKLLVWAALVTLLICGYFYFNFFRLHWQEVAPQASEGEILSTGEHSETRSPFALSTLLFYPITFLDSQAGFLLGLLLLVGLALAALFGEKRQGLLWIWLISPLILFTIIQKKQVYYTIPILPSVALLSAIGFAQIQNRQARGLLYVLVLLLGLNQFMALTWERPLVAESRLLALHSVGLDPRWLVGRSPFPEAWVWPRYAQSRPPLREDLMAREIVSTVRALRGTFPDFRIEVFSEDQTFFEGYLTFYLRCAFPRAIVNGLTQSPAAFYENLRMMDVFVYVTPSRRLLPTERSMRESLRRRQEGDPLTELPLLSLFEAQSQQLILYLSIPLSYGTTVHVYRVRAWGESAPGP